MVLSSMRSDLRESESFQAALRWLEEHTSFSRPYDRRNMPLDSEVRRFCSEASARLGNPHKSGFMVSVAGSKGKGTVSHLLCHHLMASGLSTGMALSPHLVDIRERSLVNLKMPSLEELGTAIIDISAISGVIEGRATFSGILSLAAMQVFAKMRLDACIIECGLGGEHDSTGFIGAPLCILTSVELEHTAQLGTDRCSIAAEKAGIVSEGATLVCASIGEPELRTVKKLVDARGARLVVVDTRGLSARETNERLAITALSEFGALFGVMVTEADISEVTVPARDDLRTVGDAAVLFDGAHTPASLDNLASRIQKRFHRPPALVFGCSPPRDPDLLSERIRTQCSTAYFVSIGGTPPPDGFREVTIDELPELFEREKHAVVTGSFHLVGDVMKHLGICPYGVLDNRRA